MSSRQRTAFRIGCYLALLTAAFHMVGQITGPQAPANDTERQLMDLATNYRMVMTGGAERSLMDFLNGFSLIFAAFLALTGGVGLLIARRGFSDLVLVTAVARAMTAGYVVIFVISLTYFFIVPTICLAAVTLAFAIASVRSG